MPAFLRKLMIQNGYMNEADDGSDGGAGAAADRGDDFTPTEPTGEAAPPQDDEAKAEAKDESDGAPGDDDFVPPGDDKDEPEAKDQGERKNDMIPKARFDDARRKAREREETLLQRIQALEKDAKRDAEQTNTPELN